MNDENALNPTGKSKSEMITDLSDFISAAFCVDGETKFVKLLPPENGFNCDGAMFEITDKKRGLFYISIHKPRP